MTSLKNWKLIKLSSNTSQTNSGCKFLSIKGMLRSAYATFYTLQLQILKHKKKMLVTQKKISLSIDICKVRFEMKPEFQSIGCLVKFFHFFSSSLFHTWMGYKKKLKELDFSNKNFEFHWFSFHFIYVCCTQNVMYADKCTSFYAT